MRITLGAVMFPSPRYETRTARKHLPGEPLFNLDEHCGRNLANATVEKHPP
jgi:hypothetical protein